MFAFGAVYPWAYGPLAVTASAAGLLAWWSARSYAGPSTALLIAIAVLAASIAAQLIPLSETVLASLSPQTVPAIRQLDPAFALGISRSHPLSIHPAATARGLWLYLAFALLLIGTTRLFSAVGAQSFALRLLMLATLVALAGIVLRPSPEGQIYGFWAPEGIGSSFGPFVNKNHFAGWMLMACPLALGVLSSRLARGMRGGKPSLRDRVLWLSSPDASRLILLGLAVLLMILSLLLTRSRSGMAAFGGAIALSWIFAMRASATRSRRLATAGVLGALVAMAALWVGVDDVAARFAEADWAKLGHRRGAWGDALGVIRMFPLAGTGVNTYSDAMLLFQQYATVYHFSAPHNTVLQVAAEGGLLLSIPALACVLLLARDICRRFREDHSVSTYWLRAGATTALCAIALQEMVEFSLQIPGNAALFAVMCAVALHRAPGRRVIDLPPIPD